MQKDKGYNITFKLRQDIGVVMVKLEGNLNQLTRYCTECYSTPHPNRRIHLL